MSFCCNVPCEPLWYFVMTIAIEDCGQHCHSRPRRCLPGSYPFTVRTKGKRPAINLHGHCCNKDILIAWILVSSHEDDWTGYSWFLNFPQLQNMWWIMSFQSFPIPCFCRLRLEAEEESEAFRWISMLNAAHRIGAEVDLLHCTLAHLHIHITYTSFSFRRCTPNFAIFLCKRAARECDLLKCVDVIFVNLEFRDCSYQSISIHHVGVCLILLGPSLLETNSSCNWAPPIISKNPSCFASLFWWPVQWLCQTPQTWSQAVLKGARLMWLGLY